MNKVPWADPVLRVTCISSWGRHRPGGAAPFRVTIDDEPPGAVHGLDVDEGGNGTGVEQRRYQLVRQASRSSIERLRSTSSMLASTRFAFTFGCCFRDRDHRPTDSRPPILCNPPRRRPLHLGERRRRIADLVNAWWAEGFKKGHRTAHGAREGRYDAERVHAGRGRLIAQSRGYGRIRIVHYCSQPG